MLLKVSPIEGMDVLSKLHGKYGELINSTLRKYLIKDVSPEFKNAVLYQVETGGKRVRPIVTLTVAESLRGRVERALPAAAVVELIHNYSLIYDDIIDRSDLRRGKPTVRKLFGDYAAILIGIWYREAIEEAILDTTDPVSFAREVAKVIKMIDEGERLDILFEQAGREDPYFNEFGRRTVSFDDYLNMVKLKTGSLFALSAKLGAMSATYDDAIWDSMWKFGESIGVAFQLIDDLLDVFGDVKKFGKEIGKDIKEHKLGNSVILLALEELDDLGRRRVLDVLSKDLVTQKDVEIVVDLVSRTRARERVVEMAEKYVEEGLAELKVLPDNEPRRDLAELAKFLMFREY